MVTTVPKITSAITLKIATTITLVLMCTIHARMTASD